MRFQWDWLGPVVTVPYVPALGPVRPDALEADLFHAVVDVAGTGRFLPYDKDRRWSSRKDEKVIVDEIIHRPSLTVIPTLSARGRGLLKIHYYGVAPPDLDAVNDWSHKWCTTYGVRNSKLMWGQTTAENARTRVMLKRLRDRDRGDMGGVVELAGCEVANTFPDFADQLGVEGFAFLHRRMKAGLNDGPILVAVEDRRIVGAIGPLATMVDAIGTCHQPPNYFAVHPDYRKRGHGRALWRAAMAWGRTHGAAYKILQASSGSAAERLYLSEGLTTLGFVCGMNLRGQ